MSFIGGCYCGKVRYAAQGAPFLKAQCHCRACQHISGGAPHLFMLMPTAGFSWTQGAPTSFTRPDLKDAVTREFCADCGTPLVTRRPGLEAVIVRVGTLDDPTQFGGPRMAIFTAQKQPFHVIPDDLPAFAETPPGG